MVTGSIVAIVTPMQDERASGLRALQGAHRFPHRAGTDGIVVVGTTVNPDRRFRRHKELIRAAVAHARGRIPIIAGTGGTPRREAIELTESAKNAGANACLSVVPYYNKPTQDGHATGISAPIAEKVDIPQMVYNVPGRTVADLANDTTLRLAHPEHRRHQGCDHHIEPPARAVRRRAQRLLVYSGDGWERAGAHAFARKRDHFGDRERRGHGSCTRWRRSARGELPEGARAEFQAARAPHQALRPRRIPFR